MAKVKWEDGERAFILYDQRAMSGDTDDASVMPLRMRPKPMTPKRKAQELFGVHARPSKIELPDKPEEA